MRNKAFGYACFGAFLMAFAIVAPVGCATSSGSLPLPDELMTQGVVPEGADVESLERGRALAVTECAECHRFYWPKEYSPNAWPSIVRKMGKLASLSSPQMQDLEEYFVAASRVERMTDRKEGE